ncbi:MAG: papain-like cysteine peptidase [Alphaproteobacteria bacterium]|jgi:hypothetical protein|nr:papain-like cysteine peptidase [Alphaproteobacteria bacterium]
MLLNFLIKPKFKADVIMSIGRSCRPAKNIYLCGLKRNSYPLDWMYRYNLKIATDLIANNFKDFFTEIYEDISNVKQEHPYRFIVDKKNDMIDMHTILKETPLEAGIVESRKMWQRRIQRMYQHFDEAKNICFVMNCEYKDINDFGYFADKISKKYPKKRILLINIINTDNDNFVIKKERLVKNIKMITAYFRDKNNDPKDFWMGNTLLWEKVLTDAVILKQEFSK